MPVSTTAPYQIVAAFQAGYRTFVGRFEKADKTALVIPEPDGFVS